MNCQDTLKAIAKAMGSRVSSCKNFDANVCRFREDPSDVAKIVATEGQPFIRKTAYVKDASRIRFKANNDFLQVQLLFGLGLELISINRTNQNDFLHPAGELALGHRKYPLFTVRGSLSTKQAELLENLSFRQFLERCSLTTEESAHLSAADLRLYLWQPSTERTLEVIDAALDFVKTLVSQPTEIDFAELPEQFKSLIPLIQSWGISDDVQRDERREEASRTTLETVVAQVKPLLPAINSYLDSFGDEPLPEAATALGALAEFVAETELELQKRR